MPDNQVTYAHTAVNVDNSDTELVADTPKRKYLRVQNNDAALIVWVRVGEAAVVNTGIRLGPGDEFEMTAAKNNVDPRDVNAIASDVGPAAVLIVEA